MIDEFLDEVAARLPPPLSRALRAFTAHRARVGRMIVYLLSPITAFLFFYMFYLVFGFVEAPTTPNAALGQVEPWNNHGVFHYITVAQLRLYERVDGWVRISFAATCLGILLMYGTRSEA